MVRVRLAVVPHSIHLSVRQTWGFGPLTLFDFQSKCGGVVRMVSACYCRFRPPSAVIHRLRHEIRPFHVEVDFRRESTTAGPNDPRRGDLLVLGGASDGPPSGRDGSELAQRPMQSGPGCGVRSDRDSTQQPAADALSPQGRRSSCRHRPERSNRRWGLHVEGQPRNHPDATPVHHHPEARPQEHAPFPGALQSDSARTVRSRVQARAQCCHASSSVRSPPPLRFNWNGCRGWVGWWTNRRFRSRRRTGMDERLVYNIASN
ncbi:hypothetical protein SAMN05192554_101140 [Haloarchaeobius iranensis]|uniref:Uncharacterized protein n=1 Tax=Haloarchaeobius iranensis TaxID=996166 RepID=A0A1G9SET9_9EURY|nr:hypothetical protein SAMN05192554_101140 [Haloarchaeobius iranensis]